MKKLTEINTFRIRKTKVSSIFLIGLRFLGYRCKSGVATLHTGKLEITLTVPLKTKFEITNWITFLNTELYPAKILLNIPNILFSNSNKLVSLGRNHDLSETPFHQRSHIFIEDPNFFIGDPRFLLETPRFSLESPRFSSETPDFHWRPPDFHLRLQRKFGGL